MWDRSFHGITREEGLSRQAVCTSVFAAVVCTGQTDRRLPAISAGFPPPVLRPTTQPPLVHGLFPGEQMSAGPLRLHCRVIPLSCPLVRAPLCPWVTENPPLPAAHPCRGGSPPADPSLGGTASCGVWRVSVQACRFSRAELKRKCLYVALRGRMFLMDVELRLTFYPPRRTFKMLSCLLASTVSRVKSPVSLVTLFRKQRASVPGF